MEKELNKKIDVNYFETTEVYTVKLSLFAVIVIELGLECVETGLGLDFESDQIELGTISTSGMILFTNCTDESNKLNSEYGRNEIEERLDAMKGYVNMTRRRCVDQSVSNGKCNFGC